MKHIKTGRSRANFDVLLQTRSAQAAMMSLRPGATSEDHSSNEHPASEQWIYIISGAGEAIVGKKRASLRRTAVREGSLLLVEKGELHQIRNVGRKPLKTINFYMPPAYDSEGNPK
jgi:oxalate decarboxylase/phosphoglucose isomerase-like protein (cupin superfamily)